MSGEAGLNLRWSAIKALINNDMQPGSFIFPAVFYCCKALTLQISNKKMLIFFEILEFFSKNNRNWERCML